MYRGVYSSAIRPPGGGEFFQVENLGGEVFQVDTKDMKKKLMSEWGIFSSQGGESFQVCGRIYAPEKNNLIQNMILKNI